MLSYTLLGLLLFFAVYVSQRSATSLPIAHMPLGNPIPGDLCSHLDAHANRVLYTSLSASLNP